MTRLIVIRHGQSKGNCGGFFTGSVNVELTDLGRRQAQLVADFLKDYKIDKVYSSDLDRAYETALPIAEPRGLTVEKVPGIREINGGKWENMEYNGIGEKYGDDFNVWLTDFGKAVCTGGESVAYLAERVGKAISKIVAENPDRTVAVVCHGTPIRSLNCIWRGVDISEMQNIPWAANASVSIAEYENADTLPEIVMYGYTDHLADSVTTLPGTV